MLLALLLQDLAYMRLPDFRGGKLHERGLSSVSRLRNSYTQKREDVRKQFELVWRKALFPQVITMGDVTDSTLMPIN